MELLVSYSSDIPIDRLELNFDISLTQRLSYVSQAKTQLVGFEAAALSISRTIL